MLSCDFLVWNERSWYCNLEGLGNKTVLDAMYSGKADGVETLLDCQNIVVESNFIYFANIKSVHCFQTENQQHVKLTVKILLFSKKHLQDLSLVFDIDWR